MKLTKGEGVKKPHDAATTFVIGFAFGWGVGLLFPMAFLGWEPF